MSAIWGIINKKGKPIDQQLVDAIFTSIAHRATDGKSLWIEQNVALGHCLLKVHPQQNFENQPEQLSDLIITADARLDNRAEIGVKFGLDRTQLSETPDSTLLLMAYRHWGDECVQHLEGEYAFAIWDKHTRQLFAATDHIGFRPFFYYDSPDQFIFCSEIKGVVAAKPLPNYFEEESLIEYFYRKGTPSKTYNKEVFALCGGNVLTLVDSMMHIAKYWNFEPTNEYTFLKTDEEWYACAKDLLIKAIEKRLNTDIPTGIKLSGGLDSTSIACILSEALIKKNKPLYAVSSVLPSDYKGNEKDERSYMDVIIKYCPNIVPSFVAAPDVSPCDRLEEFFEIEESFPNAFFYMDKALLDAAKDSGVRNLFSGYGGDFLMSWSGSTVVARLMQQHQIKDALALILAYSKTEHTSILKQIHRKYFAYTKTYRLLRTIKNDAKNHALEIDILNSHLTAKYKEREKLTPNFYTPDQIRMMVNDGSMGRMLSKFYNRNSNDGMDSSIPMFDKSLLEFLTIVPIALFAKDGINRSMLRTAMRGVMPEAINNRVSKGIYVPDYEHRIVKDKDILLQRIQSMDTHCIIDQYLNKQKVLSFYCGQISKTNDHHSFNRLKQFTLAKVYSAVYICDYLKYLCK